MPSCSTMTPIHRNGQYRFGRRAGDLGADVAQRFASISEARRSQEG
jgi:hypothetical protein